MKTIRERIAHTLGADAVPGLIALSGADHTSLALEIAKERAAQRSPAEVLAQYESDRFVRPSRCDPFVLGALRMHALRAATEHGHVALELAPLAPLGTSSTVATASQHKIVSTVRQTEAISDCSNVLALESASRRRRDPRGPAVHLTATARVTRAQALERPEFTAHFELFVTTSAGRDPGGRRFEEDALSLALTVQLVLLDRLEHEGFPIGARAVRLSPDASHEPLAARVRDALISRWPSVPVVIDGTRIAASGYYRGLCFGVYAAPRDAPERLLPLGDGGLTDWVAKLTARRNERFFVGALGLELLASVFAP
jgi:hypothetical protein